MTIGLTAATLAEACADDSSAAGIRIFSELEPVGGPGTPVKPAVYEGGRYQLDRRWAAPDDAAPTDVVVIDNVPSQANRLEAALYRARSEAGLPVMELDLSGAGTLPPHLPKSISVCSSIVFLSGPIGGIKMIFGKRCLSARISLVSASYCASV